MKLKVLPYKLGSRSGKALADALNVRRLKRFESRYRGKVEDIIINWGCSRFPEFRLADNQQVLNWFYGVNQARNKLLSFAALENAGVLTPEYTNSAHEALGWYMEGETVVVRHVLDGTNGEGIQIIDREMSPILGIPVAPLYVKYKKKKNEFRAHVAFGKVIDIQQKRKKEGEENANYQIRNHHNGWVYCRENIQVPEDLEDLSLRAVAAHGLDFGAVDIIWNGRENKSYVLEVNTAPGLEGQTVVAYSDAFINYLEGQ